MKNKIFAIKPQEKWILVIAVPLVILLLSFLVEKQIRNVQFSNYTLSQMSYVASEFERSNYVLNLNNMSALATMNFVAECVQHKSAVDNKETMAALLSIRKASETEMVYLMDIEGEVVASTPDITNGQTFTGNNFSFRPYFYKVIKNKTPYPYAAVGVVSNKRGLYLGFPIFDSLQQIVGVAAVKSSIDSVEKHLFNHEHPVVMISPDSIIYASNKTEWLFKSLHPLSKEKITSINNSRQFASNPIKPLGYDLSSEHTTINGIKYIVKSHPIFNGSWHLIILFKPYTFNSLVFILTFILSLVFFSGFYLAYRIYNKLKMVNRLSERQKDYSQRIFEQQEAIIHLNKSQIHLKNWEEVQTIITETGANVLNIERASIWQFNNNGSKLICIDRYIKSLNEHESGQEIDELIEPRYFEKLKNEISIVADDIYTETYLSGLYDTVFNPKGIKSILHVPIIQQEKPTAIICIESVGSKRHWNRDEKIFCERLANRISLFLLTQHRRNTAAQLEKSNISLQIALEEAKKSKELQIAYEALQQNENNLHKAYNEIKDQQYEMTKLNKKLAASHQYTLELNKELVGANDKLEQQKNELESTIQHLKDTQAHLIQTEKLASVGILTAGIAHEINNPLNFILGGKTALELHVYDNYPSNLDNFKPMFEMIEKGVDRATEIINSLNHFNRCSETYTEQCNLHTILDNCLIMMHNSIKHKITIDKEYMKNGFNLIGNEGKLHQVFINIISNAVHSIEKKGTISLKTLRNGTYIKTIITDNGVGIEEQHLKKIMDPFFTTKAPGKGTGLGLSIAHSIIQEHEGFIEYKSQVGKGTSVTVSIPINQSSV